MTETPPRTQRGQGRPKIVRTGQKGRPEKKQFHIAEAEDLGSELIDLRKRSSLVADGFCEQNRTQKETFNVTRLT